MDVFTDPRTGRRYTVDAPGGQPRWLDPPAPHPLVDTAGPSRHPVAATKPRTVAGTSGVIVGGLALLLSWVPIVNTLAFVLALVSGALATVGLIATRGAGRRSSRWTASTALVLTVLSMAIVLATQALYSKALDEVSTGLKGATAIASPVTAGSGSGSDAPASAGSGAPAAAASGSALPEGATRFGATVTFSDGSTLTCGKPVTFRRDRFAIGAEKAAVYLKSRCTFTNRSTKTFNPAGTTASMSAGGAEGESVFQADLDSPDNPVLPGRSVTWWMGYGVASTSGAQLTVRLGFLHYDAVTFA